MLHGLGQSHFDSLASANTVEGTAGSHEAVTRALRMQMTETALGAIIGGPPYVTRISAHSVTLSAADLLNSNSWTLCIKCCVD